MKFVVILNKIFCVKLLICFTVDAGIGERLGDVPEAKWEYDDQQSTRISDIIIDEEAVMLRLGKFFSC